MRIGNRREINRWILGECKGGRVQFLMIASAPKVHDSWYTPEDAPNAMVSV